MYYYSESRTERGRSLERRDVAPLPWLSQPPAQGEHMLPEPLIVSASSCSAQRHLAPPDVVLEGARCWNLFVFVLVVIF